VTSSSHFGDWRPQWITPSFIFPLQVSVPPSLSSFGRCYDECCPYSVVLTSLYNTESAEVGAGHDGDHQMDLLEKPGNVSVRNLEVGIGDYEDGDT
jgi:hypothetical protein